jgi:hypothetical protein
MLYGKLPMTATRSPNGCRSSPRKSPSMISNRPVKFCLRYSTDSRSISTTLKEGKFLSERKPVSTPIPGPTSTTVSQLPACNESTIAAAILLSFRKCWPRCFLALTLSLLSGDFILPAPGLCLTLSFPMAAPVCQIRTRVSLFSQGG